MDDGSVSERWLYLQMNKSRREADETMAELDEAKQESHMAQREGEIELEKARPDASRQNNYQTFLSFLFLIYLFMFLYLR